MAGLLPLAQLPPNTTILSHFYCILAQVQIYSPLAKLKLTTFLTSKATAPRLRTSRPESLQRQTTYEIKSKVEELYPLRIDEDMGWTRV